MINPIPGKFYQLKDSGLTDVDSYLYLVSYEGTTGQFSNYDNYDNEHDFSELQEVPPMIDGVCTPNYPFKEGDKFIVVDDTSGGFPEGTEVWCERLGENEDFIHRFDTVDDYYYQNPWHLKPLVPVQTEFTISTDF